MVRVKSQDKCLKLELTIPDSEDSEHKSYLEALHARPLCKRSLAGMEASGSNLMKLVDKLNEICGVSEASLIDVAQVRCGSHAYMPLRMLGVLNSGVTWYVRCK